VPSGGGVIHQMGRANRSGELRDIITLDLSHTTAIPGVVGFWHSFPVRQRRFAGLLIGALRPSPKSRVDAGPLALN
jgi:hypothetical protein